VGAALLLSRTNTLTARVETSPNTMSSTRLRVAAKCWAANASSSV